MPDIVTAEVRSRIMAAVNQRDTKPELIVRSLLHRLGFRFRLNCRDLSGSPDIVLPRHRTVIFVHGCFWHQHSRCKKARKPSSNTLYWNRKLAENIARDQKAIKTLKREGWKVHVIWECMTEDSRLLAKKLQTILKELQ